ncbi:zinc-ribbon domain-containing protein [Leifsonia sp. PS1209]|nr:zinc-ribbon domain-containing protein [Leifsonia sp. PS1209]
MHRLCNECGAVLEERDTRCPRCGTHRSEIAG